MRHRLHIVVACIAVCLSFPACAVAAEALKQTEQEIEAAKERQEQLAAEQKKIAAELADIQKKLVAFAARLRETETALAAAEGAVRDLDRKLIDQNAAIAARHDKLQAMTQAALHLSRMPPEALAVMPGDKETMKAAQALRMTSDGIRDEMERIKRESGELGRLQQKAAEHRDALAAKREDLKRERETLQQKLTERAALQAKIDRSQKAEAAKTAELAKKAENLQGLISAIKRKDREERKAHQRSFAKAKGKLHVPVAGELTQRFGGGKKNEQTDKGIILTASVAGAEVVAPFDGEIAYAGRFLNYGNMVILKHSDGFHTLLAGLDDIDASVGDFLLEGEPIGAMGREAEERRLYVELRKHNQPMDPEPWMKALKQKKR